MNKRWMATLLLVLSSLLSSCSSSPNSLIERFFIRITSFASLSWLGLPGSIQFATFTRILVWILAFTLYFAVIIMLGNSTNRPSGKGNANFVTMHKSQAIAIAMVLATISAIYIPVAALFAIGSGWATLLSLLFIGAPVAGFAFLLRAIPGKEENGEQTPEDKGHVLLKIVLTLILYWVLSSMYTHIATGIIFDIGKKSAVALAMGTALEWSLFFLTILLIYYFFRLFVVDGLTEAERKEQSAREKEHYSSLIKRLTDPAKKNMQLRAQRAKEAQEARQKRQEEEEARHKKHAEEEQARYAERRKNQEERRKSQEDARKKQQEEDKKKRAEKAKLAKERQEKQDYFNSFSVLLENSQKYALAIDADATELRNFVRKREYLQGQSYRARDVTQRISLGSGQPLTVKVKQFSNSTIPKLSQLESRIKRLDMLLDQIWVDLRKIYRHAKKDRDFFQQIRAQVEAVRGEFTDRVEHFAEQVEKDAKIQAEYQIAKINHALIEKAAGGISLPFSVPAPDQLDPSACISALDDVRSHCGHINQELEEFKQRFA